MPQIENTVTSDRSPLRIDLPASLESRALYFAPPIDGNTITGSEDLELRKEKGILKMLVGVTWTRKILKSIMTY